PHFLNSFTRLAPSRNPNRVSNTLLRCSTLLSRSSMNVLLITSSISRQP
ncbi:hypothetical protein LINPERPRIM_LOCUS2410, partial [Linum perenne]